MTKEEIIKLAETMGFEIECDKFDYIKTSADILPVSEFIKFVSKDKTSDGEQLTWIWHKDESDDFNIRRGKRIKEKLS